MPAVNMQQRKFFFRVKLATCLAVACLGAQNIAIAAASEQQAQTQEVSLQDVRRFSAAINHIKSFYVDDIKDKKLFEDAIRGMLNGLDPHSDYLDTEEFKDLKIATMGEYGGLGIEITMDKGYVKVIAAIEDTPASRVDIKSGDLIMKLDDKIVKGLTLRDAVGYMRGKPGTEIALTIFRPGDKQNPRVVKVLREVIQINTVKSKVLDKEYGYIRISHFQEPTAGAFAKAVAKLQADIGGRIKGLVLDLRNNPGGLLDAAIEISDHVLHNDNQGKEEVIVMTKGRVQGTEFTANAKPGDLIGGAPIVVLINEGSASGSEIVAGALQDNKRAVVLGTKSFGKGSVQTVLPLDDQHGIKLTTARYYTPSGRSIQAKGIEPDIIVTNVKLSEVEKELEEKYSIKEADLLGHLDSDTKELSAAEKAEQQELQQLATSDNQLFQALTLLKGLDVLHQKHYQEQHAKAKTKTGQ